MKPLVELLRPGDMRTTGASSEVAAIVLEHPCRVEELVGGMEHLEPGVRMRSADALEKICRKQPQMVASQKPRLLAIFERATQPEVQWHAAQILRHLNLSTDEADLAEALLTGWLRMSRSAIVKADCVETLAALADRERSRWAQIAPLIEEMAATGPPSVAARVRKVRRLFHTADG